MDERLRNVVSTVLGLPKSEISPELGPSEAERWDSLGHLELILAIEKEYGVRFRADDIPRLKSVSDLERALKLLGVPSPDGCGSVDKGG